MAAEKDETPVVARVEPAESGVDGGQVSPPAGSNAVILAQPVSDQKHLGAALHSFVDVRSAAVSTIAVAAFHDAQESKAVMTREMRDLRSTLGAVRLQYHEQREENVRLDERVAALGRMNRFQQMAIAVGSLVAGTGLPLIVQQKTLLGMGGFLSLIGMAVLVLGFTVNTARRP